VTRLPSKGPGAINFAKSGCGGRGNAWRVYLAVFPAGLHRNSNRKERLFGKQQQCSIYEKRLGKFFFFLFLVPPGVENSRWVSTF